MQQSNMRELTVELELNLMKAVEANGFELCSMAHDYPVYELVSEVNKSIRSQKRLRDRLKLTVEAFLKTKKKRDDARLGLSKGSLRLKVEAFFKIKKKDQKSGNQALEQSNMKMRVDWIRSFKVSEPAEKLHYLMVMVAYCGIERSAIAFKVEDSKILEIVSKYQSAMGSRLKRLYVRQSAFYSNKQFIQEFDLKQIEEEWDQIYSLSKEIEETAAKHYDLMKTQEELDIVRYPKIDV